MRAWYPVLVAATIGCVPWCLFMYAVFPIGPVDGLYGNFRPLLADRVGDEEARRLMPYLGRAMVTAIHTAVLCTCLPLFLTNIGWACFAYRLLRKTR